jgi:integrase
MFVSERGAPLSAPGFSRKDGVDTLQAYLGHRNIQNTTRYTALAPDRFKGSGGIRRQVLRS